MQKNVFLNRLIDQIIVRIKEKILIALKRKNKNLLVTRKVSRYVDKLSEQKIPRYIIEEYENILKNKDSNHQTPLNQLQFLGFILKITRSKNVLEIGTYKGLTALFFAYICGENSNIVSCENNSTLAGEIRNLWKKYNAKNIQLIEDDALKSMGMLEKKNSVFDFIYIDADKKEYANYYSFAKKLSRPGTIIAIDNALWAGLVPEKKTTYSHAQLMQKLNADIFSEKSPYCCIITAWDGLLLLEVN